MVDFNDTSLLSTAQITLYFTGCLLLLGLSCVLTLSIPCLGFHLGRFIYGCQLDIGNPGVVFPGFAGFVVYSGLCGFAPYGMGPMLRYFLMNVPFGMTVLTLLVLLVFAMGVGIGRLTGLIEGEGKEKVKKT